MTDSKVGVEVSGGQLQGIVGAGSVVIENLTFYSRAAEEPVQPTGAEPIGPCPYPGLAYFGPTDAHLFFGRDAAITRLAAALDRQSFTALVGASGSGKSSVVLAGLAPRLHTAGNWRFSHFRLGTELDNNPFLALARALAPLYVASDSDVERLKNTKLLADSLASGELTLRDIFADCRNRNQGRRILLIADQFEEAFTLLKDDALQSRFIDLLLAGFPDPAAGGVSDICLMLTMRADFYGRALRHRPLADALQGHVENLGPMTREELQEAIVRPAANAGVAFEPGLVETLLDTVQSKPGGLPLLQFALREMWGRQERKKITRKSYDEIGRVEGALAQRAETVFAGLTKNGADPTMDKAFQRLFTRLVTLGEGQQDTRRVVARTELGDEVWGLAQRLAGEENRLVVTSASSAHETAEVVHEALIRNWPKLVDWINRDRAFQSWLRQIHPGMELWLASPDDDGPLLRGGMLVQATEWLARRRDDLSDDERAYVEASSALRQRAEAEKEAARQAEIKRQQELTDAANKLAEEQRQRAQVARRGVVIASAAAVITLALAVIAVWQIQVASRATAAADESHRLAVAGTMVSAANSAFDQSKDSESLQRSLLFATGSLQFAWTPDGFKTWANLIRLARPAPKLLLESANGPYASVAFSPDGKLLAAAGKDAIFLMNGASLETIAAIPQKGAHVLTFSPGGDLLAAGVDRKVFVWNVAERKLIKELPEDNGAFAVRSVVFDGDAKRLAFAGQATSPRIFETATWSEVGKDWSRAIETKRRRMFSAVFSPDQPWLLANGLPLIAWDLNTVISPPSDTTVAFPPPRSVEFDESGRAPYFIAFSQDGRRLAVNGSLWSVAPAKAGAEFHLSDKIFANDHPIIAINADASVVATSDGIVWRVSEQAQELARLDTSHQGLVAAALDPNGKWLVRGGDRLERWDLAAGAEFTSLQHDTEAVALASSPDSRYVATTTADGLVHVWNTKDWTKAATLVIQKSDEFWGSSNVAFSGDGRWLAATIRNVVKIFAVDGWREVAAPGEHKNNVTSITFSADSRWLIAVDNDSSSDSITAIAMGSLKVTSITGIAKATQLGHVSISPDQAMLSVRTDARCLRQRNSKPRFIPGVIRIVDMETGERVASNPLDIDALPAGCRGRDESTDDVPEPPFGKTELFKDQPKWNPIVAEVMAGDERTLTSPDGRWFATTLKDSIILRFENTSVTLPHFSKLNDVLFLRDGKWLLSTSPDGKARVWALSRDDMIALSCKRLKQNLSPDDWKKYLKDEPYKAICPELAKP